MKVKIIAVGTEVLTGLTINTNAAYIGSRMTEEGYQINKSTVVADDRVELLKELHHSDEDIIVLTGGLGPTVDDFTKEVVSSYVGINLVRSEEVLKRIKKRFEKYNVVMDQSNYQQALVFEEQEILFNDNGTAPGFFIDGKQKLILLPGPPKEMIPMFEAVLGDKLALDKELHHLGYKLVGIGESSCEGLLRGFYERHPNVNIAPYALSGEIKYILRSNSLIDLDRCNNEFKEIFSKYIIGDYTTTIYDEVLRLLKDRKLFISFAESCTGGMATSKLVDLPGSSSVLIESIITYGNSAKSKYLNVSTNTLNQFGAVSYECVEEMILGLEKQTSADVNVAISGIAGPGGSTPDKPVGLVYIGVKYKDKVFVKDYNFVGNRTSVRERATHMAYRNIYRLLKNNN